ncbi:PDR/VanB family oxidoreductase [Streptomyces violascens]|uniref:PDR/VanB family oxidoreductase n=1 Tax=Streptomyces violascens TaxID=67381 RepID=UPI003659C614
MSTAPESQFDLLVHRMTWEAEGVLSVELVHPEGKPLAAWEAGAHIDVHAGDHIRQYSLCGDPGDVGRYRIGVLDEPSSRGGSRHLHTQVRPGDTLTVKGPRNHFALVEAESYLFIAGGIGITPILAQAKEAGAHGRPWRLWHGGRRRASMAFGDELLELVAEERAVTFHPLDEHGHLDLGHILAQAGPATHIYCCGPEPLLVAVEEKCAELGLRDRLHVERFAAVEVAAPQGGELGFEVECRRSGRTLQVGPEESIVEALEDAGIPIETSCREGVCGTCETAVLDGIPDHRDMVLTADEQDAGDAMMLCVSRCSSGRLVLDV